MDVAKEVLNCKLDLVKVQNMRWDRGGIKPAGKYTFPMERGTKVMNYVQVSLCKRIISEFKRVGFFSDRI
jgi:hypothetical protein